MVTQVIKIRDNEQCGDAKSEGPFADVQLRVAGLEDAVFRDEAIVEGFSLDHEENVELVKNKLRQVLEERNKDFPQDVIERVVENNLSLVSHHLHYLDPQKVNSDQETMFGIFGLTSEKWVEICSAEYLGGYSTIDLDSNMSNSELMDLIARNLNYLHSKVENANEEVFYKVYSSMLKEMKEEEFVERICCSLKGELSEEEYDDISSRLRGYYNFRNSYTDEKLERILFNDEISTVEPFPLQGKDKINFKVGEIYAAIAAVTGEGIGKAINYYSKCSPEAFCIDRYSGSCDRKHIEFREEKSYEEKVNCMIMEAVKRMPWSMKDRACRLLSSATSNYNDGKFEKAFKEYKKLYYLVWDNYEGDPNFAKHAAYMCYACIKQRRDLYLSYHLYDNAEILEWLNKARDAGSLLANEMIEGLRITKEKREGSS